MHYNRGIEVTCVLVGVTITTTVAAFVLHLSKRPFTTKPDSDIIFTRTWVCPQGQHSSTQTGGQWLPTNEDNLL